MQANEMGPLALEIGRSVASGVAGMLLRAGGVSVLRVEFGDELEMDAAREDLATYHAVRDAWLHSGKLSVAFRDHAAARATMPGLVALADVVIDGLEYGARDALALVPEMGIGAPWVCVTPHGRDDPRPSADLIATAVSGAVFAIGRPDREPLTIPHEYASFQAGAIAATAAMASLVGHAAATVIDVAVSDVISAYAAANATLFTWKREGHRAADSGGAYPYTILPARDGYVCLAVRSNGEWRRMLEALDNPAWADDPRVRDVREMADSHADELDELLSETLAQFTCAELLSRAATHGCAIAPVRDLEDIIADPDLRGAGVIRDVPSLDGRVALPRLPWLGADDPEMAAPAPGEHNAEVRRWLRDARLPEPSEDVAWSLTARASRA